MFDAGVVERLTGRARQLSQLHAALLGDLVAVFDATPVPEFAGFEVAAALTWTRPAADAQLELARAVVRRLPSLHAAMAAGDVDLPKAKVIVDGVVALERGLARDIVAAILPQAPKLTTGQLRARLAKLVIAADPAAAAKRHKARVRQRRVVLQPTEDSCADVLGLNLPADDALAATNRLTALARALKQAGDPRSLDQLRADTFLNLLLGNTCSHHNPGNAFTGSAPSGSGSAFRSPAGSGSTGNGSTGNGSTVTGAAGGGFAGSGATGSGSPSGSGSAFSGPIGSGSAANGSTATGATGGSGLTGGGVSGNGSSDSGQNCSCSCGGSSRQRGGVELTGDLQTLAGLAQRPGDLAGYGPVIAEIARQVAAQQRHTPWTFTIRDDTTGQIFTGPVRRRPSAALARHIRARDRTCRAPGCRRPGIYADIDHTIAYERGGLTIPGNLGLLCRYHRVS